MMLLILADADFQALPEPLRRCLELGCKPICGANGQLYFSIPLSDRRLTAHLKSVFALAAGVEYEIRSSIPCSRLFYTPH